MTLTRVLCDLSALVGSGAIVFGVAQWSYGGACITGGALAILWASATAYALQFEKVSHDRDNSIGGDPRV